MNANNYKNLLVWQKGHALVLSRYKSTEKFPQTEAYGLTSQMRRAAVSITSNIAEGFARNSSKEKVQFYYLSLGSLSELSSQSVIAKDLGYLTQKDYGDSESLMIEVSKMLHALIRSIST